MTPTLERGPDKPGSRPLGGRRSQNLLRLARWAGALAGGEGKEDQFSGDYRDKWRIERLATAVRGRFKVDQFQPLSPSELAEATPAHIFHPEDFGDDRLARRLRRVDWRAHGAILSSGPSFGHCASRGS